LFYIFLLCVPFICIAIARNKNDEYLKQSAFTVMITAVLNCIALAYRASFFSGGGNSKIVYLGAFQLTYNQMNMLFNVSLVFAFIGLIAYLFSDVER
jgi:hypothetical protein